LGATEDDREGFTRCARPLGGLAAMQNGVAVLSFPGRGFSSPSQENMQKKSPEVSLDASSNLAVRGGFTRCARPSGGLAAMQNGVAVLSSPGRGFSSPSQENIQKKVQMGVWTLLQIWR